MAAAALLAGQGVASRVLHLPFLKPLEEADLITALA
jgi:transketolase C-terminal domain/subunit